MQSITLIFKPSYSLASLFLLVSAIAIGILYMLPILLWLKLLLSVIVLCHASYVISKFALLKLASSIIKLELNNKGELRVFNVRGEVMNATLQLNSFVSPWLTVVNLKVEKRSSSLLVLPMNTDSHTFRRLRVWLKWHKKA